MLLVQLAAYSAGLRSPREERGLECCSIRRATNRLTSRGHFTTLFDARAHGPFKV